MFYSHNESRIYIMKRRGVPNDIIWIGLFQQKQFRSLELEKRKMSVGVEDEVSVPPQSTSQEHPTDNFARFLELKESAQTIEKILGPELTRARRHRKWIQRCQLNVSMAFGNRTRMASYVDLCLDSKQLLLSHERNASIIFAWESAQRKSYILSERLSVIDRFTGRSLPRHLRFRHKSYVESKHHNQHLHS